MKLIVLALFLALAASKTLWHQLEKYTFEDYTREFGKSYSGHERTKRKALFENQLEAIRKHNANPAFTWKKGINHLTDRTEEEFKYMLGLKTPSGKRSEFQRDYVPSTKRAELPTMVDWRQKNVVSPVKDQGQCGSCWAFATAECLESYWALKTGELAILSEQQILDCTPNPDDCGGTGGCGGGTSELAYARMANNKIGGLASEWTYPYKSYFGQGFKCNFSSNTPPVAKVRGFVKLPTNQYQPLMEQVANHGPVIISVDASAWATYESGVFDGCNQTNPDIDHAVVLEGYGTDASLGDYWLVRNSWSPSWGEKGYIRLRRTSDEQNRCGTDLNPKDGTGCNDGPPTQYVCGTCAILFDTSFPVV